MSLVARIAKELKGRATGNRAMVCCPAHNDRSPSLSVAQIAPNMLLVHCHAGCPQEAVVSAMKHLGLWPDVDPRAKGRPVIRPEQQLTGEEIQKQIAAREIWNSAGPIEGTLGEQYLRSRRIMMKPPSSLRFAHLVHGPTQKKLPALVAAITDLHEDVIAVQRIFLRGDGTGKADVSPQKMCHGVMLGGAAKLACADGMWLGVAEGVETGLSAQEMYTIPVWAACGARMHNVEVPSNIRGVVVFADNGAQGAKIAERAAEQFVQLNLEVVIRTPPEGFGDFNDEAQSVVA
jgi:hypothetical protein